jgi:flagellar hook protein FlgE
MPNFSIPLSGLTAESTALSAIANNLSNQNTTGYKDTSVLFSDLFYQNLGTTGSGDPIQVGAGTEVGSMPSLFTQGSVSSTGVPTDVAIQGSGFFAVQSSDGVVNYGMPRVCAERGILSRVVPLADIPAQILLATRPRKRA